MEMRFDFTLTRLANFVFLVLLWPGLAQAMCFQQAAATYKVSETLLRAVARVESGLRVLPPSHNRDGSYDIGIMRINSRWLPSLRQYGITREALDDACVNIQVGAWILANNRARLGESWNAVGAYNVGCNRLNPTECEKRRLSYSWKVYCAWRESIHRRCARGEEYGNINRQ
jgi:soluble lytic murein transglycosylase-like protein